MFHHRDNKDLSWVFINKTAYRQSTKVAIVAIVAVAIPKPGSADSFATIANFGIYTFLAIAPNYNCF